MQPQFCTADHQGIRHIIAAVAHENELFAPERSEMLADGQHIRQNLRRVEFVCQAVPDGNAGIFCQFLHDVLAEAAILDTVIQAAQNTGGVCDGFFFADLRACGIQIGDMHPEIIGGDLEGAASAGGGLFENQRDGFALQRVVGDVGLLLRLQLGGEIDQTCDLLRREVQKCQKVSALEIHVILLIQPRSALALPQRFSTAPWECSVRAADALSAWPW